MVFQSGVDALEIHTQVGRVEDFKRLWSAIAPWVNQLKLLAISCPDGEAMIDYLRALYELMAPLPCPLIWQTDGRPMSGDIGDGTTRAAVKLGQKVLTAGLPGYVQLAGGTNRHTVGKLRTMGLLNSHQKSEVVRASLSGISVGNQGSKKNPSQQPQTFPAQSSDIAGIAYGSYARVLLSPILDELEKMNMNEVCGNASASSQTPLPGRLEEKPDLLWQAVGLAHSLVSQLKTFPQ